MTVTTKKYFAESDMYDNRDEATTYLHIIDVGIVVVDPSSIFMNMVENCFDPNNRTINRAFIQNMIDWLSDYK